MGSQYIGLTKFINLFLIYSLFIYIVLCQGENKIIFKVNIDDQNTTCVFASKGT